MFDDWRAEKKVDNIVVREAYAKTGRKTVVLVDEYDKPLLRGGGRRIQPVQRPEHLAVN